MVVTEVLLHTDGPALWPSHKPLQEVLDLKATTPERIWEGTYQGNPVSPQGSIFKRKWWSKNRYDIKDPAILNKIIGRWISFDTADKDGDDNAYTAAVVGDLWPDYRLAIRHVWRDRLLFPDLPPQIESICRTWNYDDKLRGVIIEDKASGTSAIQTLRGSVSYDWIADMLTSFLPTSDKVARAVQSSTWAANQSVLLPWPSEGAMWLLDFEDELFGFPTSIFADQVDAFSQLILFTENLLAEGYRMRAGNLAQRLAEGVDDYGA